MPDPGEEKIEPKLAETGFYKTVHEWIAEAMNQYFSFFSSYWTFDTWRYKHAVSSLCALYNGVIVPHNLNNPSSEEVIDFVKKWEELNRTYGNGFEDGNRNPSIPHKEEEDRLRKEYSERYTLIMTYLNTLGLTQMKQRGEAWEDAELDVMMGELE